jgi:hypothetical protein
MLTAALTQNKRLISLLAALLISTSAVAQVYEPVLVTPQILGTPTTMTPLNLGDDATRRISLGFEFDYWDQTFTDAWVSSNGFVSFQSAANLCCSGQPIEQAQRNTIYGYWSDLVSYTGNPYFRRDDGSILFGWYGTSEYGTNNSSTFEIGLFSDGRIQLNYGSLGFSGNRNFTAGLTGPTADDNISLFYGRNAQFLQNQSGILSWTVPTPVVTVDCRTTPMDPSCPPISIDPMTAVADAVADAVEQSVVLEPEEMEQVREMAAVALDQAEESAASAEENEAAAEAVADVADTVERLEPNEVAALAAGGLDIGDSMQQQDTVMQETQDGASSSSGTFTTQFRFDNSFGGSFVQGPSFSSAQSASPLDIAISASSPMSMSNTVEALGLGSPQPSASGGNAPPSDSGISEGESETIAAIGTVPGFAAYTQASLQDRADFYAIRDIYRRRRLQDANFEMYRMMQTNDARWQEMVDEQYE